MQEETNQGRPLLPGEDLPTPRVMAPSEVTDEMLEAVAAAPVVEGSLHLPAAEEPQLDVSMIMLAGSLDEAIGLSLGAASMCWTEPNPGTFRSEAVLQIMGGLRYRVNENTKAVLVDFITWFGDAANRDSVRGKSIDEVAQMYLES